MVCDDITLTMQGCGNCGLFFSDPRLDGLVVDHVTPLLVLVGLLEGAGTREGSSRPTAPQVDAFQVAGHSMKSLLYTGFFWAVDEI
jgi:hypothetical protein